MENSLFSLSYGSRSETTVSQGLRQTGNGVYAVGSTKAGMSGYFFVGSTRKYDTATSTKDKKIGYWGDKGYVATQWQNITGIDANVSFADNDKFNYVVLDKTGESGTLAGNITFHSYTNSNARLVSGLFTTDKLLSGSSLVELTGKQTANKHVIAYDSANTVTINGSSNQLVRVQGSTDGTIYRMLFQGTSSAESDNQATIIIGNKNASTKTLKGGNSSDTIVAALASGVSLTGGNGADTFIIGSSGGGTQVTITDYSFSSGDDIKFVASASYSGNGKLEKPYAQYVYDNNGNLTGVNVGEASSTGVQSLVYLKGATRSNSVIINGATQAVLNAGWTGYVGNNIVTIGDSAIKSGYTYYYSKLGSTVNDYAVAQGSTTGVYYVGESTNSFKTVGVNVGRVVGGMTSGVTYENIADFSDISLSGITYEVNTETGESFTGNYSATNTLAKQAIDASSTTKALNLIGSSSDNTLRGGAGNNFIYTGTSSANEVSTGAGKDTVVVGGGSTNEITLGDGSDVVYVSSTSSNSTVTGFDINEDRIAAGDISSLTSIDTFVNSGSSRYFTTGGTLVISDAKVELSATNGAYAAALGTTSETQMKVIWAGDNSNTISANAFGATNGVVIIGENNGTNGNLINGSDGKDTILAGSNDSVNGGAGNDTIYVASSASSVYVGIGQDLGKDTVYSFRAGFDDDDSTIVLTNGTVYQSIYDASINGSSDIIVYGNGSLDISDMINGSTNGGAAIDIKVTAAEGDFKVSYVNNNSGGTMVIDSADTQSDIYYGIKGKDNGVDFSNVESGTVVADLGGTYNSLTGSSTIFVNINDVQGSSSVENLLIGSTGSETLRGGEGVSNTLIGGAGNDSILAASAENSSNSFYVGTGQGKDTIKAFSGGENTVYLASGSLANFSGATRSADRAIISFGSSDSVTLLDSDSDTKITYKEISSFDEATEENAITMKVGMSNATVNYESDVDLYINSGSSGTIEYIESDAATIDLSSTFDTAAYSGYKNITNYGTGDVQLGGNNEDNQILNQGTGTATLWGGAGGNDTLQGNAGSDETFYYLYGNGNDVINSATDGDTIWSDVSASQVTGCDLKGSTLKISFADGGTLTVNNFDTSVNFAIQGGTVNAKYDGKEWSLS